MSARAASTPPIWPGGGGDTYAIVVYDIEVERIDKVRAILRRHLFRVQNSVFEGEISEAALKALKVELKGVIKDDYDSIIFYIAKSESVIRRDVMGIDATVRDFIV